METVGTDAGSVPGVRRDSGSATRRVPSVVRAGMASCDITPPAGVHMAGYPDRVGVSEGVHDPLWARTLVCDAGTHGLILVSCDAASIDRAVVASIRHAVAEAHGPQWTVFVATTHTHAGPLGLRPPLDPAVCDRVTRGILDAVAAARARLVPVRIGTAWTQAPGIAASRRSADVPHDPLAGVIRIDGVDGRPVGAVLNFACHPTVLSARNRLYTQDLPGPALALLESTMGHGAVAMFMNGAAGDVSTRFTRAASTFEECERLGRLLGRAAASAYAQATPAPVTRVLARTETVALPRRRLPPPAVIEAALVQAQAQLARARTEGAPHGAERIAFTAVQGLERQLVWMRQPVDEPILAEVGAFVLGAAGGVTWPGEFFNAYAVELRRRAGSPVFVFGYANGAIWYVPTPEAFAQGGYEAASARVDVGAGDQVVQTSLQLLDTVRAHG